MVDQRVTYCVADGALKWSPVSLLAQHVFGLRIDVYAAGAPTHLVVAHVAIAAKVTYVLVERDGENVDDACVGGSLLRSKEGAFTRPSGRDADEQDLVDRSHLGLREAFVGLQVFRRLELRAARGLPVLSAGQFLLSHISD